MPYDPAVPAPAPAPMTALVNYELHRTGVGLVPPPGDGETALYVGEVPGLSRPLRSCTCKVSRRKTCAHLQLLAEGVREIDRRYPAGSWERVFSAAVWYRLARVLFEGRRQELASVEVAAVERDGAPALKVSGDGGRELAQYLDVSPSRQRFLERLGKTPRERRSCDRAALLESLALLQATSEERLLNKRGGRTQRQAWEASFWHRLAYHCVRETGLRDGSFHPAVDQATGRFTLTFRDAGGRPLVEVTVPPERVAAALALLAAEFPEQEDLAIHPVPLKSIFRVSQETDLDLVEVRPAIVALQEGGEERFFEQQDFERFRYGNLVWVKELGVLAELERESRRRRFKAPARMRLARSQVPGFLAEYSDALAEGSLVLDDPLEGLRIFKDYDRLEIEAPAEDALGRSWTWLSVRYGFGNESISLARLLEARRQGLPYVETRSGWVDLDAPAFRHLDSLLAPRRAAPAPGPEGGGPGPDAAAPDESGDGERVRLSAAELLRLAAASCRPPEVSGEVGRREVVERLLALRPARAYRPPAGLVSPLRPYQELGVDWLRFLWENRLGGLLCDDMGLGKTHQAMALMLALREAGVEGPVLVVCPTSVLPHWRGKIAEHAPSLEAAVHHGPQRDLAAALAAGGVLLTSYGVLRRDAAALAAVPFALVVLDEIQHVKNRETHAYRAAAALAAEVKLGLTGTPVENALADLKALFDLVLPGYLGGDADFDERYGEAAADPRPEAARGAGGPLAELKRLAAPFVLRRLKSSVLEELPEKFEDLRTCALSDDQVKLYRDAVATRGDELAGRLRQGAEPIPYIHVFALLNLLKQICDHPALALRQLPRAGEYASGKWDLYREVVEEALGAEQKVVVFTQYLGMIALMQRHLEELGVGFTTLTGASTRRGEIVDRFNLDPACRVFLGSLKAGGTGIDLVGGSVVVHYDRWWNAAREDQATDRVHRIGQKRAVQVIKLVTEGTLEEKIAALIEKKRRLAESVIDEDDPKLAKVFTREELLELLAPV